MAIIDIQSQRFNRLTVLSFSHIDDKKRGAIWNCVCDCGEEIKANGCLLRIGRVMSCGCLRSELRIDKNRDKLEDLTGKRYGMLVVIGRAENKKRTTWTCRCDCGKVRHLFRVNFVNGGQISCGCEGRRRRILINTTHGLSKTPIYHVWRSMLSRCYNPNHKSYKDYGGRGISVCRRWQLSFVNFYNDMKDGYAKGLQLDRRKPNGNYHKKGCRWATAKQNSRNRRNSPFIKFMGKTKCVSEWAELYNIPYVTLWTRLKNKWAIKKSLLTPVRKSKAA